MFDGSEGSIRISVFDNDYDMLSWLIVRSSDDKGCYVGSWSTTGTMLAQGSNGSEGYYIPDEVGCFTMQDH